MAGIQFDGGGSVHILSFMILWAQKWPEPATSERIAQSKKE
jgi:hypothetical protein